MSHHHLVGKLLQVPVWLVVEVVRTLLMPVVPNIWSGELLTKRLIKLNKNKQVRAKNSLLYSILTEYITIQYCTIFYYITIIYCID